MKLPSEVVASAAEILDRVTDETDVVGIDEGQFFDASLVGVVNTLADRGKRVIVAGLDQDFMGQPFEPMPELLAVAEYVDKTLAICMRCGAPANRTQRLVAATDRVIVGGADQYEARCRQCFRPGRSE
jgi:thymidine kinase